MKIGEFEVEVERKKIKNMHLAVYPPNGRVHISVPEHLTDWDISTFLYSKLGWIRKQYEEVTAQHRQDVRDFVTGESHYLFGERYLLQLIPTSAAPRIDVTAGGMDMYVRPRMTRNDRASLLFTYYRTRLREVLERLVAKWTEIMSENSATLHCPPAPIQSNPVTLQWDIDMLLRKWGECHQHQRRITFSLLLARVPLRCIEYVVVHELAHLQIPDHSPQFTALLTRHLPDWRPRKQELDNFITLPLL